MRKGKPGDLTAHLFAHDIRVPEVEANPDARIDQLVHGLVNGGEAARNGWVHAIIGQRKRIIAISEEGEENAGLGPGVGRMSRAVFGERRRRPQRRPIWVQKIWPPIFPLQLLTLICFSNIVIAVTQVAGCICSLTTEYFSRWHPPGLNHALMALAAGSWSFFMPAIYPVYSCRKSCPWMQKSCQTQPKSCRTRMEVVPDSPEVVHKNTQSGERQSLSRRKHTRASPPHLDSRVFAGLGSRVSRCRSRMFRD